MKLVAHSTGLGHRPDKSLKCVCKLLSFLIPSLNNEGLIYLVSPKNASGFCRTCSKEALKKDLLSEGL